MKHDPVPPKTNPVLKSYTAYCLHRSAGLFREMLTKELSPWGVLPPQLGMLKILTSTGAMNQVQLGDQMMIDKATMVKLIDGLEKLGYVERSAAKGDRRVKILAVTKAGAKALEKMAVARERIEEHFLKCLTKDEKSMFKKVLAKLVEANSPVKS